MSAASATAPTPAAAPAPPAAMPPWRAASYMTASVVLALVQGLGMNFVAANIPQIGGDLSATQNEANWLIAAYMAPNVSLTLILIKVRTQYGLRNFAELSVLGFVIVATLHLFVDDLQSALIVRFVGGIVASPMSTLAFLYMLEPFPPAKKLTWGLALALTAIGLGAPLARLISPVLLSIGDWHALYAAEIALACIGFAAVYLLPLSPIPRAKVIHPLDVLSYLLIAVGFGLVAVVLALGRVYWWFEAPWLGVCLAVGIAAVTAAAIVELDRENPFIDIRWLTSPEVLHFTGALLVFRIVLAEQTSGASGLFQALGLLNEQTTTLYAVIIAANVAGGFACAFLMGPGRERKIHLVALLLLLTGALMDSQATSQTRPEQMFLSQGLIALAGALFLPPALYSGLMSALKKGPNYILSFVIIFLTTQSIGGLLGSALLGSFVTLREKLHSSYLVEHVVMTDPVVAQRVAQYGHVYDRVLTDRTLANAEGLVLLSQQATREANVLAYNDLFLLVAALSAAALVILLAHMAFDAIRTRVAAPAT